MPPPANLLTQSIRDVTLVQFNDARIREAGQIQRIGEALYALIDAQARRRLVLDFGKVEALSSGMLGVLLNLRKKADEARGNIVICGMNREIQEVFQLARVHKLFRFCETEDDALAVFGVTRAG